MGIKLLLDTDIGSDIDDAICLAYLLAQPECELLGITTVTGEAVKRAMLASALCRLAGRDVPIRPGAEQPLLLPQAQPLAPQAQVLSRWPHATTFPQGEAVAFMRQTIRAHPGEVVLLAIGPLTNVALLFATDEEIPGLLKGLVLMCGVFMEGRPGAKSREWNARLDPHATAMVYRAATRMHRSIGLDVTTQVKMPADAVRERFQSGLLEAVLDMAEVWFKEREVITFHDPLAATTVFDEEICRFEKGQVTVALTDEARQGATAWRPGGADAPHEVATAVNSARFFEHFFATLS